MVVMMLYVLETMQWFLKTAFGQSESPFGGTRWVPSMGLGQGNGASMSGGYAFVPARTLAGASVSARKSKSGWSSVSCMIGAPHAVL